MAPNKQNPKQDSVLKIKANIIIGVETHVGLVATQIAQCYTTCLSLIGFLPL